MRKLIRETIFVIFCLICVDLYAKDVTQISDGEICYTHSSDVFKAGIDRTIIKYYPQYNKVEISRVNHDRGAFYYSTEKAAEENYEKAKKFFDEYASKHSGIVDIDYTEFIKSGSAFNTRPDITPTKTWTLKFRDAELF